MATENVSNQPLSTSYPVLVDRNAANDGIQVVRLDVGIGTAEDRITSTNPLPTASYPASYTTTTETNPTSTTSSTQALAANADRKGGYLVNDSDTDIHVSFGGTATTSKQKVRSGGGVLPLVITGLIYKGAINTIHAGSGSKTLYCVELT
jgi:hypothetical protein